MSKAKFPRLPTTPWFGLFVCYGAAMSAAAIDETTDFTPRFGPDGLIPVIATDAQSGEVLMLAYMNREALDATLSSGQATYWSRSRQQLWRKGETSGHTQEVVAIATDCDQDALLLSVRQNGSACHTGRRSCFYRRIEPHPGHSGGLPVYLAFTVDP